MGTSFLQTLVPVWKPDEAHYNVQTEKGWFSNGRGYFHTAARPHPRVVAAPNPFYVEARRVDRLDEDTYTIQRGQVTSCDNEEKGWTLSVRSAKLEVGDKLVARGVLFRLMHVPLFYMPVMAGPVRPRAPDRFPAAPHRQFHAEGLHSWGGLFLGHQSQRGFNGRT